MRGKHQVFKEKTRGVAGILVNIFLTVVSVAAFNYAHVHYYTEAMFYVRGNYVFLLLYVMLMILLLSVYGAYRVRQYRTRELIFSFVIGSVLANVIIYLVMCLIAMQMLRVWAIIIVTVIQWFLAAGIYVLSPRVLDFIPEDSCLN